MPRQEMMQENAMSRIDARIPVFVRETIDRAAAMQGRTRTDFLIAAALEKAEQVIEEHAVIRLTLRDQKMLAAVLTDNTVNTVQKLPSHIASAVSEYNNSVSST